MQCSSTTYHKVKQAHACVLILLVLVVEVWEEQLPRGLHDAEEPVEVDGKGADSQLLLGANAVQADAPAYVHRIHGGQYAQTHVEAITGTS